MATVSQDTTYAGNASQVSYSSIQLLPGIPHEAQLEVERIFTTAAPGSVNTLEQFLNSPNVSSFHKRKIFVVPSSRVTYNQTTKTTSTIDLPTGAGAYIYTAAAGFSVTVPAIANGQIVTVSRKTISNLPLVTWVPGTKLTTNQLNTSITQSLYLSQEILGLIDRKIAFDSTPPHILGNDSVTEDAILTGAVHAEHLTADTQPWALVGTLSVSGLVTLASTTASQALFTDASKGVVSKAVTGTGNVVLADGATLSAVTLGNNPTFTAGVGITGTATNLTAGTCQTIPTLSGDVSNSGNAVSVISLGSLQSITVTGTASVGNLVATANSGTNSFATHVSIAGNLNVSGNISGGSTTTTTATAVDKLFYIGSSPCSFTGVIGSSGGTVASTDLVVTSMTAGQYLSVGSFVTWAGQTGTIPQVTSIGSSAGGNGTYTLNTSLARTSIAMAGTGNSDANVQGGGLILMGTAGTTDVHSLTWSGSGNGTWSFGGGHLQIEANRELKFKQASDSYVTSLSPGTQTESRTLTLPVSTGADTLVSRKSSDTLENKAMNFNGSLNRLYIDGTEVTTTTGTGGSLVRATDATLANPTFTSPQLGTVESGILTGCTGLPVSTGISGLATGIATFLGTPSSANLAAAVTDETGFSSGAKLVFSNDPTISLQSNATINLGVANLTGILGVNKGGTGWDLSTFTPTAYIGNSIIGFYGDTAGTPSLPSAYRHIAGGTSGQVLTISPSNGPVWQTPGNSRPRVTYVTTSTITPASISFASSDIVYVTHTTTSGAVTLHLMDIPDASSVRLVIRNTSGSSVFYLDGLGTYTQVKPTSTNSLLRVINSSATNTTSVVTAGLYNFVDITILRNNSVYTTITN